jgi:hypothetical protein
VRNSPAALLDKEIPALTVEDAGRLSDHHYRELFHAIRDELLEIWSDVEEHAADRDLLKSDLSLEEMKCFVASHAMWFAPQ